MNFSSKRKTSNLILLISAFVIVSLILWNTNSFFKKFKEEERLKMEIWATAQLELVQSSVDQELGNLTLKVLGNNTSTPMILVNEEGSYKTHNIPEDKIGDSVYIRKKIAQFRNENEPIQIIQEDELLETLYYGNSEVLNKLKYYPLALLLIIFLFGAVIFFFFRTNKASEQNKLWAGMAKETAHQIGTPLTSLLGWNELLKSEAINPEVTREIAKDISRLETITERFSKIGSVPELRKHDIVSETKKAYDYLKQRSSKLVHFSFSSNVEEAAVLMNPPLYNWSIENLVKNGIDAMKGKGNIAIQIEKKGQNINILVSDTGHGIPKSDFQNIFNPGVTSKQRGWGLGLSLVKRIVEEYHKGKIKVFSSSKEGTIMQISLKALEN
ncbi:MULTISPECIES: sensor histidine kinase [Flavobacteriaceae]|jgi:signal transduction histidine kinase|uniref:histidine kinase n=1 Tax=Flagellimonas sp. MMG031 TaxID=3158549 RepID=A0AAU7MYN1_9FLAO|nr:MULTISPECIES: HAMP domain-containing sensor histidine kinase [unclassified Allomuricauda]MBO6531495.1 HAMP domain-containing histidine kinase [Allomuricauda sp.]MBO6587730.1 HAMP domain-containing histidine kinase [Allomuricauda sp.]MBO6617355.1 HAMP domain-containing histidine kinase [Allomuricauda sp.]MBO6643634.1 HAMP domain-containing histidine kinase [Allomuricauda sp.]MBO6745690.1 HAMP domain-containing histidine kinase [Allomuricauda sp.]